MDSFDRIPDELRAVNQWHCWKSVDGVKIPIQVNGSNAKSNDPSTWTDFERAVDASQFYSGLAFEITEPWIGIDLDDCIDDNGLKSWVFEILFRFDGIGFAEISPSQTGIKIITRGRKPEGYRSKHTFDGGQIEVYDNRRFWTITGDTYNGQDEIRDGQAAVDWLCEKYLSHKKIVAPVVVPIVHRMTVSTLENRALSYLNSIPPAAEGHRNSSAFSLAGHLRSFEHDGQKLSPDQVLELCRQWNARNAKPLPDDELKRAVESSGRNGTQRESKPDRPMEEPFPEVDLSLLLGESADELDDDEFFLKAVPPAGLLREIFDYYCKTSHRTSTIMGMAVAVSLCETIFGRRIATASNMRTNDYNMVMAPTAAGKEACESVISKILNEAAGSDNVPMLPGSMASGNGLLKALGQIPASIWVCDEFGKVLESVINPKSNIHLKQIADNLLRLYSKSHEIFTGCGHADGNRNRIVQPHLCVLGLTTSQVFNVIRPEHVQDGLLGRIAIWHENDRPKLNIKDSIDPPESLVLSVRRWLQWSPMRSRGNLEEVPMPSRVMFSAEAKQRIESHSAEIDKRAAFEIENRAAIWCRVAMRSTKLALVHRAARVSSDPSRFDWSLAQIEIDDMNWGIAMANRLARISCNLILSTMGDIDQVNARKILNEAFIQSTKLTLTQIRKAMGKITAPTYRSVLKEMEESGRIRRSVAASNRPGRPTEIYERVENES